MQAVLQVRGLTVTRRGTRVLRGLDWTVQPGEFWTILGPNGSGKTSLLGCLTGLLMPSAGLVRLLGETYGECDWIGLRRRVGLVSSAVRQLIDDEESALRVIASGASGQINHWGRLSAAQTTAARRAATTARCTAVLERPWAVLSQGERQRVLIARALAGKPDLLILDEPCAGLDPVARERFVAFVQKFALSKRGPALVLVTHHLDEIPPACTHILALNGGRVVASGVYQDILRADTLSRVFGQTVTLHRDRGRWIMGLAAPHRVKQDSTS